MCNSAAAAAAVVAGDAAAAAAVVAGNADVLVTGITASEVSVTSVGGKLGGLLAA